MGRKLAGKKMTCSSSAFVLETLANPTRYLEVFSTNAFTEVDRVGSLP